MAGSGLRNYLGTNGHRLSPRPTLAISIGRLLSSTKSYWQPTPKPTGPNGPSPAREGPALLQGLAVCGRCGRRMTVGYHLRGGVEVPEYRCMRTAIRDGTPPCHQVPGASIDAAIGALLLESVTPLALEVALSVQAELEARADEADALRRSHVERARHGAELARRRYLAVDPDNRLVADSLEADWNDALRQLRHAQDEYERAAAVAKSTFTEEQKSRIRALATDFPRLWSDPATPQRERKRMARLLIEDVTMNKADKIYLGVRFRGGKTESLVIPLPLTGGQARQTDPGTLALLDQRERHPPRRPNTDYSRSASVIWPHVMQRIPMGRTRTVPFGARIGSTRINVWGTRSISGPLSDKAMWVPWMRQAGANPTSRIRPWLKAESERATGVASFGGTPN